MQPEHQEDEIEIDLKELFFELLGHWQMILLSTVLVATIAFVISKFIITPQYESTSELFVLSKSTSITSLADIQTSTNLTNDYLVVAKNRPVIEKVIEQLGLDETYSSLSSKITITNPSDSRLLQITVTDSDNDRAKVIADELADVVRAFIYEKMDQEEPTVISYGYSDWVPVSPNIGRNTILGGLVGMLLAMAIVIITYLLNDSIMTPEDLERKIDIHVLGSLPWEESEDDSQDVSASKKSKKSGKSSKTVSKKKS